MFHLDSINKAMCKLTGSASQVVPMLKLVLGTNKKEQSQKLSQYT